MKWTKTQPTIPGWYWTKRLRSNNSASEVGVDHVRLYGGVLVIFEGCDTVFVNDTDFQWSSAPIFPPSENSWIGPNV